MGRSLTLLLGGARSGKSAFAQALAGQLGQQVTVIATAEAGDEEMRLRIENHRRDRPSHWQTIEAPRGVAGALRAAAGADVVLLDCLALLVSNLLLQEEQDPAGAEARVEGELASLLTAHQQTDAHLIVVTNEVGLGVVPAYELGRAFRDALGRANARLAREATHVYWMAAGLAMEIKASGLARPWEEVDVRA